MNRARTNGQKKEAMNTATLAIAAVCALPILNVQDATATRADDARLYPFAVSCVAAPRAVVYASTAPAAANVYGAHYPASHGRTVDAVFLFEGTVSEATHEPRAVLASYLPVLDALDVRDSNDALRAACHRLLGKKAWNDVDLDDAEYFLNESIPDAFDLLSPEGYVFGAHEGDGADFGFWATSDANDVAEYDISGDFLSALINDDYSGVDHESPNEAKAFRAWRVAEEAANGPGFWDTNSEEPGYYAECDFLKAYTTCYAVRYVISA